jgi:hypothetical protein
VTCFFCRSPAAHPATGHQVTPTVLACRECFLRFFSWYRARLRNPVTLAALADLSRRHNDSMKVRIDGAETELRCDRYSGARGHQYLTPGCASSHAFPEPLRPGQVFRLNGHRYEVWPWRDEPSAPLPSDIDVNNPG